MMGVVRAHETAHAGRTCRCEAEALIADAWRRDLSALEESQARDRREQSARRALTCRQNLLSLCSASFPVSASGLIYYSLLSFRVFFSSGSGTSQMSSKPMGDGQ